MLDALDVTSNEQHDSETLAEHVFRRIQAAMFVVLATPVIRRLSTMLIYSLTKQG